MITSELVESVRVQIDEANQEDVTDNQIIAALNRAQQRLVHIAGRKYNSIFMREVTYSASDFSDNGRSIALPTEAFGLTINMVEALYNGATYKIFPAQITQMTTWVNNTSTMIPRWWATQGDRLILFPNIAQSTSIRIRYQVRPPELLQSQGRIVNITSASSGSIFVDEVGETLSTSVDALRCFINVIDGQNGLVKSTNQIASINSSTGEITIKTASLNRSVVFGRPVSDSLPSDLALDDYIVWAKGTCIPQLYQDYTNFLVQFAVVETRRRMGEDTTAEYAALKEMEEDVQLMWSGRPASLRVENRSKYWSWRLPLNVGVRY